MFFQIPYSISAVSYSCRARNDVRWGPHWSDQVQIFPRPSSLQGLDPLHRSQGTWTCVPTAGILSAMVTGPTPTTLLPSWRYLEIMQSFTYSTLNTYLLSDFYVRTPKKSLVSGNLRSSGGRQSKQIHKEVYHVVSDGDKCQEGEEI